MCSGPEDVVELRLEFACAGRPDEEEDAILLSSSSPRFGLVPSGLPPADGRCDTGLRLLVFDSGPPGDVAEAEDGSGFTKSIAGELLCIVAMAKLDTKLCAKSEENEEKRLSEEEGRPSILAHSPARFVPQPRESNLIFSTMFVIASCDAARSRYTARNPATMKDEYCTI